MAKHIGSFFERFKRLAVPDGATRDAVSAALKSVLGADVDRSHITMRGGIAHLSVSSVLKAEVQMKQQELLLRIREILAKEVVRGFR